jgi:hypothetical protein
MRIRARYWGLGTLLALGAALMLLAALPSSANGGKGHGKHGAKTGAMHVRWDIISLVGGNFPGPANPGGSASASAANGGDTITLTGTGTFVAPAGSNGGSGAVTGGGTWHTSTASGTYEVKELVSFVFANFQALTPVLTDNIGALNERANGTAVLRVRFSDGPSGVLTVGCHGPGAPPGIFEGIAVTKGYVTYYNVAAPAMFVDANRTIFHVSR